MRKKLLIVKKFGGTSLATIDKIKKAANIVKKEVSLGNKVIVIVSAIGKTTDKLQSLINKISLNNDEKEIDSILSSGEQASSGLMALALKNIKINARSFLGWQIPIFTNTSYGKAKILDINSEVLKKEIKKGITPVIAGFQGISNEFRISTIGRGGSDTTAVAIASKLSADRCDIHTDVDGVFTADPRWVKKAKKIDQLTYDEMLEMASVGAQVLEPRSVSLAKNNNVALWVKSSSKNVKGTKIHNSIKIEKRNVSGIVFSKNDSKITLLGIPDKPGVAAKIFGSLADKDINVDMIVQNISSDGKYSDLTFTISEADLFKAKKCINQIKNEIKIKNVLPDNNVAKISIVGIGMRTNAGIAEDMFKALGQKKINIDLISTSEIKISVLISRRNLKKAINILHKTYDLE
ncbi:MAG: aspartate kinase [Pelagibacteraceae bacterium]|nr:aspartate kinase [Pelagibacteraceae bacterium]|tara:strand:- start:3537 stop:4757 length:1221 start_codon:yes stop_codon:yes gene_type:complete